MDVCHRRVARLANVGICEISTRVTGHSTVETYKGNYLFYGSIELHEKQALHTLRGRQPSKLRRLMYKIDRRFAFKIMNTSVKQRSDLD